MKSRLLLPVVLILFAAAFLRPFSSLTQADGQTNVYIVQLHDEPLATYRGGLTGLPATSAEVTQADALNADSSASRAYLAYLDGQQQQFQQELSAAAHRPITFLYQYQIAFNGVAVSLTSAEAEQISHWRMVEQVRPQAQLEALSHGGPRWIGADTVWQGTSTAGLPGTKGEGVIIGILDTGITPTHIAFADIGADGYNHTNPWGSNQYTGVCNPANTGYDPTFPCNDKLIGAWNYADGPRDNNGHGTHVASIAAGNFYSVTIIATTLNIPTTFSGVAPHANLVAYDVCAGGYCSESSILAALNQVVLDGVDVINVSLGMGAGDPWSSAVSRTLLGVREAGIFVAVAAGNTGPTAATINAPANAPWVVSVGNVNHGRTYASDLVNMSGGTNPPANLSGVSMSSGYGPTTIVYAGNYGDPNCATAFPAGTWQQNEIVLCEGGNMSSATNKAKSNNVKAGGAKGVVIMSAASLPNWRMPNIHAIPAAHISYSDGEILKTWLATPGIHTATITGSYFPTTPNNLGDVLYTTSSRGPNPVVPDVLKPDLVAPGFLIQGAYHGSVSWANQAINQYTGTSQASPHVAGAAALLQALHPDWTPGQIQSAMMTTALSTPVRNDDYVTPATPTQQGSGRVDLTVASQAGLLMDETGAKFAAANPTYMGDPTALNLPSFAESNCPGTCQWTRTVSNALNETVSWEVSVTSTAGLTVTVVPSSFVLLPGATQTFTVTADVNALTNGTWVFASVVMHNPSAQAPDAHFPIAVLPANVSTHLPANVTVNLRRDQGSQQVTGLQTEEITDLTTSVYGVAQAHQSHVTLSQDTSRNDPYNNLNDGTTFFVTVTLPALTEQFIAEIVASDVADMDLYVGVDTNMDGLPAAAELVCASAKTGWQERCVLNNQMGVNVWVVAQNFQSTGAGAVTIAWATITPDNNGLTVSGPATVPAYTPFALDLVWNLPGSTAGNIWYALVDLGTDPASPGNIGRFPVRLVRHSDDVSLSATTTNLTIGEVMTYTITIQPNLLNVDTTYSLTNTVPFGLQIITGTLTGGATLETTPTNTLVRWSGALPTGGNTPVIITYQATVDPKLCLGTTSSLELTNELVHSLDNPGSVAQTETVELFVEDLDVMCPAVISLDLTLSTDGSCGTEVMLNVEEGTTVTYCYTVRNVSPVPLNIHHLEDNTFGTLLNNWPYPLPPNTSTSFTVTAPAEASSIHLATWVANNAAAAQSTATVNVDQTIQQLFIPLMFSGH